nr:methionine adenosyltransferase [Phenylobacterium sp. CCH12-B4]
MSLEAAAGKNPVSHVGKIYNVAARQIAEAVISALPQVTRAECLMVSRIGAPITEPAVLSVRVELARGAALPDVEAEIDRLAAGVLAGLPARLEDFIQGRIGLF